MSRRSIAVCSRFLATLLLGLFTLGDSAAAAPAHGGAPAMRLSGDTLSQIESLLAEKSSRTPAQRKIDSQLLQAVREARHQKMAAGSALAPAQVPRARSGNALVDIDVVHDSDVDALLPLIEQSGGRVVYPSHRYSTVRAEVPFSAIESIAARPATKFIVPARMGATGRPGSTPIPGTSPATAPSRGALRSRVAAALAIHKPGTLAGAVESEGDHAHGADTLRNLYGFDGTGVRVGVLSDSYDNLGGAAADVTSGDLPGTGNPFGRTTPVTVVQDSSGVDEGRAMVQIVHDIAPGAQLFFATANGGPAAFATNILALRNTYHCDVIIDDYTYFNEPVFQDGIIAQAVATVTADGALFFTNAGNEGSVAKTRGAVWEGDFNDAGSPAFTYPGGAKSGTIHNFGTTLGGDPVTRAAQWAYELKWADPLGASSNDYDLFYVNSSGTVLAQSTNIQSGTQDPNESIVRPFSSAGDQLIVFKTAAAAARPISLDALRGALGVVTTGQIFGHHTVPGAFSIAATPAHLPAGPGYPVGPFPGVFTGTNTIELFDSDGPRRMFYNADGTPITPGNTLFATSGGTVRNVPDFTAADGAASTFDQNSGFNPFYGTSAAAPHAGAIAALLRSANNALTAAQIRSIFASTSLDIESAGWDNISGLGIIRALQAIQTLSPTPFPNVALGTYAASEGPFSNGNGAVDPGETASLVVQLSDPSTVTATNVVATLSTTTSGVTITQPKANYGSIAASASASNSATPFRFGLASSVGCGSTINFYLTVTFDGGTPQTFWIPVKVGKEQGAVITSTLGSAPPTGTNFISSSATQTGRLTNNFVASSCAVPKASPGSNLTGSRRYDAYTFTNTTGSSQCVTVTLDIANEDVVNLVTYGAGGYVPTNAATNYLADGGAPEYTNTYSFAVPAGQTFTNVVSDESAGSSSPTPYTLRVSYSGCAVAPSCTSPVQGTATLPGALFLQAYSQQLPVTGGSGAYAFTPAGPLPPGLTLSTDGILSGSPTQPGSFVVSVNVADAAGCGSLAAAGYAVTVTIPPFAPALSPPILALLAVMFAAIGFVVLRRS